MKLARIDGLLTVNAVGKQTAFPLPKSHLWVMAPFYIEYRAPTGWTLEGEVAMTSGRLVMREAQINAPCGINSHVLRDISLDSIIHHAAATFATRILPPLQSTAPAGRHVPTTLESARAARADEINRNLPAFLERDARFPPERQQAEYLTGTKRVRHGRHRLTREFLRDVAAEYRRAITDDERVAESVSEWGFRELGHPVAKQTASRWIWEATKAGFLPQPERRGKKRGATALGSDTRSMPRPKGRR